MKLRDRTIADKICETGQAKGFVSALTFANLVYVLRRELDPKKTEEVLKKAFSDFFFCGVKRSGVTESRMFALE